MSFLSRIAFDASLVARCLVGAKFLIAKDSIARWARCELERLEMPSRPRWATHSSIFRMRLTLRRFADHVASHAVDQGINDVASSGDRTGDRTIIRARRCADRGSGARRRARSSSCFPRSAAAPRISIRLRSGLRGPAIGCCGRSRAASAQRWPLTGIDMHDYAADVAAVIAHADSGPAFVVGHAFGNRVARMLATDRPDLVRAVALVAANIGKAPSPPDVRAAIRAAPTLRCRTRDASRRCDSPSLPPAMIPRAGSRAGIRGAGGAAHRRRPHLARRGLRRRRAPILYLQPGHDPARACRGRRGLQGAIRRPRDDRGDRARQPCRDRGAARRRQRCADRLCARRCGRSSTGPAALPPCRHLPAPRPDN